MPTPLRPRARLAASVAALLAVVALSPAALAAPPPKFPWQGPAVRVKPGRVIVTFAPGTTRAERRAVHAKVGGRPTAPRGPSGRRRRRPAGALDERGDPPVPVRPFGRGRRAGPIRGAHRDPNDRHFDPHQWALHNTGQFHRISESGFVGQRSARGLNDRDVDAPAAWDADAATPDDEAVVAVLDNGVDIDHPDLVDALWTNEIELGATPNVDDDGNGYVDDVHGWDFRQDDANPSPGNPQKIDNSHGTHVAGIVAATRGNAIGVAGICDACRIIPLRFDLSLGQEIEAIEYAVANGADVINMSFASPIWSAAERAAIEAAGDAGVLTVAAAANFSADNDIAFYPETGFAPAFPASYTLRTILSVAASNHKDQYALVTECDLSSVPRWRCAFTSWGRLRRRRGAGVDMVSTIAPQAGGDVGTDPATPRSTAPRWHRRSSPASPGS